MNPHEIRILLTWLGVVLGSVCLACLAVALAFGPDAIAAGEHLRALGLPVRECPGCALCGLSRGFALVGAGRAAEATALNPAVVVVYPLFWFLGVGGPAYAVLQARRSAR